jgi:hypothetical protein
MWKSDVSCVAENSCGGSLGLICNFAKQGYELRIKNSGLSAITLGALT